MKATSEQKQLIHIKSVTRDMKEEWVQWATGDINKKSTNELSFEQANKILEKLGVKPFKPKYYAKFDNKNPRHRLILSLMRQAQWVTHKENYGEIPDMDRLDTWLKSNKAPISKPLMDMNSLEIEKTITALKGIVKSVYK